MLARVIERGINASLALSCGRFFDVVAAVLGCALVTLSYEGEAVCVLEAFVVLCYGVTYSVIMSRVDN